MKSLLAIAFSFLLLADVQAQSYYTESGTAVFHSQVPMHTFSGTSEYLTGMIDLEEKIVDFYLDLNTLETGIAKRDRDMRETLETDKFRFAEFYGRLITDFNPDSSAAQEVTVEGSFKIHGVEKDTTYTGTLKMEPEGLRLKASWILKLEEYDIVPPSLLFVKVDQEQKIEIEALLKTIEE